MRMSREAMAEHHREIVAAGARMLRERGVDGVSVADLMKSVGLTHGGFYRHFASKDAFVREAVARAFLDVATMRDEAGDDLEPRVQLEAWIDYYLSLDHCQTPEIGCPIAALGPEIKRCPDEVRLGFADGVAEVLEWTAKRLTGSPQQRKDVASRLLALMVGAVVTARVSNQPGAILDPARREARRLIGTR